MKGSVYLVPAICDFQITEALEEEKKQGQTLPIQIVVGSYNLKEGDKITLPSGLKCEVIAVNAKVIDEYGNTYMLFDNEIE